jgi:hypothetical protein
MANEPVKTGGFHLACQRRQQRLINGCGSLLVSPAVSGGGGPTCSIGRAGIHAEGNIRLKSVESLSGLLMAVLRPECGGCERVHPPPGSA